MRAAVATARREPLALRDVPKPEIGPRDALLRVEASGICYTDLRLIDGRTGTDPAPIIPGHEPVGTVEEVGAEVDEVAPGDRVGAHALYTCGVCDYCRAGEEEACVEGVTGLAGFAFDGGYAEYLRVPADHLVPLPAGLAAADAAPFFCAGLTVYAGLKNAGLRPGQRVAVIGIGGLGHLAVPIAKAMGAAEVYAVTGSPDKAAVARDRGADWVGDAAAAAQELARRGGAHIVLSTANSLEPLGEILPGVAKQGAIVLLAADGEVLPIPPPMFTALQIRVIGSFFGSRQDVREVLDLAMRHDIRPLTENYPLDEVNMALERLRANAVRFRAVLQP